MSTKLDARKIVTFFRTNLKVGKAELHEDRINRYTYARNIIKIKDNGKTFEIHISDEAFESLKVYTYTFDSVEWNDSTKSLLTIDRSLIEIDQLALLDEHIKLFLLEYDGKRVVQDQVDDIFGIYEPDDLPE